MIELSDVAFIVNLVAEVEDGLEGKLLLDLNMHATLFVVGERLSEAIHDLADFGLVYLLLVPSEVLILHRRKF